MKIILTILLAVIICTGSAIPAQALLPAEVLVIANRRAPDSVELARYYLAKRGIPPENLLTLTTTDQESCSREAYNREIAQPVRSFLQNRKPLPAIRAFVTLYGIPLKVYPPCTDQRRAVPVRSLTGTARLVRANS